MYSRVFGEHTLMRKQSTVKARLQIPQGDTNVGQIPSRTKTRSLFLPPRTKTRSLCYHPGQKRARCFSINMYVQSDVIIMRALQL